MIAVTLQYCMMHHHKNQKVATVLINQHKPGGATKKWVHCKGHHSTVIVSKKHWCLCLLSGVIHGVYSALFTWQSYRLSEGSVQFWKQLFFFQNGDVHNMNFYHEICLKRKLCLTEYHLLTWRSAGCLMHITNQTWNIHHSHSLCSLLSTLTICSQK